jgi:hypothetical protein
VSELPAIWSDQEDHQGQVDQGQVDQGQVDQGQVDQGQSMAPAPAGLPVAPPPPPPSPAADASLLEQIVAELAGVEAALRRLDDGSYGTCEVCGTPCDADRLAADPLSTRCSQHAG